MTATETMLIISAALALASAIGMHALFRKTMRLLKESNRELIKYRKESLGYAALALTTANSWHIVEGECSVAVARTISVLDAKYTSIVKIYPFSGDDRDYAIRCAEELCDKLNEQI